MTRLRSLPVFVTVLALAVPIFASPQSAQLARSVTVYRDNYGVPHVYGPTDASCVFGYIFAQAEDNFRLAEIKEHSERTYHRGEGKP